MSCHVIVVCHRFFESGLHFWPDGFYFHFHSYSEFQPCSSFTSVQVLMNLPLREGVWTVKLRLSVSPCAYLCRAKVKQIIAETGSFHQSPRGATI
jgi:hypothetical protein